MLSQPDLGAVACLPQNGRRQFSVTRRQESMVLSPISFNESDPCPCHSGNSVGACRCKARRFVPPAADIGPSGLITGVRVSGCYANTTANCRLPMSNEHAIEQSISRDWGSTGLDRIMGDGSLKRIPVSSAGRKVLCKRHNSALSSLDKIGHRFVAALKYQHRGTPAPQAVTHTLFNGYDIERWMLKILCATCHGMPSSRLGPSDRWFVPINYVDILFGGRPFPRGGGLYIPRVSRGRYADGILTAAILGHGLGQDSSERRVIGISLSIYGSDFDLHVQPPFDRASLWYRTRMFKATAADGGRDYIHLGWEENPPTFAGKAAFVDREHPQDDLLM
jgi:hypothetical protein